MSLPLKKRELRERTRQLQTIMCDWDPIGVTKDPAGPRDEYDCLVGPVMRMLEERRSESDISKFLRAEIVEHFGLRPDGLDFSGIARRVRSWFEQQWTNLSDPTTIFVALLDEGTDVWRPVEARQLSTGAYRIIGVDADVTDEVWEFPAGSTVRCEPRTFADGEAGLVAVLLVEAAG